MPSTSRGQPGRLAVFSGKTREPVLTSGVSQRDLEFVGVGSTVRSSEGWRQPTGLYLDDPLEVFGLSAEDSAVLHSLMDIEFLG
jgi:hypothetical protein